MAESQFLIRFALRRRVENVPGFHCKLVFRIIEKIKSAFFDADQQGINRFIVDKSSSSPVMFCEASVTCSKTVDDQASSCAEAKSRAFWMANGCIIGECSEIAAASDP